MPQVPSQDGASIARIDEKLTNERRGLPDHSIF